MRTSRGTSTEAVYIFYTMLRRLRKTYAPEYLAVAYESEGPTFRDQEFAEYKANRAETPPELVEQFPLIERLLAALRIPVLKAAGYEADDLIGTAAARLKEAEVVIVSSDKDLLQLVNERVSMLDMMKDDTLYDPAKVKEFKGVGPERIADLLALVGDPVDNIPGAPGIGDKGAVQLLEQFGSLDALLERAGEVTRKAYRESLLNNRERIEQSKRLATIACDAPLEIDLPSLAVVEPDREALGALFRELEFLSFLKELEPEARAERVAVGLDALGEGPVALVLDGEQAALCSGAGVCEAPAAEVARLGAREWIVHDYKSMLSAGGPELAGRVRDLMLEGFLALADPTGVDVNALSLRYREQTAEATPGGYASALFEIAGKLKLDPDLERVYEKLDLPLAPVLARMERTGVRIDTEVLKGLGREMETETGRLAMEIFDLAKHPFNINSPQQLGKVLFEEMGIPAQGRTGKTKNYSTAADVLEALAPQHEIAQKVLDYRQLTKLKGTYVDALPQLLGADGRLHTTFNPAGAATGRLSSSNPNLQNIPVRTEQGRAIRAAFVPEPGWVLLVADYSQIELRLLAHFSRDAVLVEAFRGGEDIHTRTAAEVFGVHPLMVTSDQRRAAKTVNFGIVYGQTAFGLAAQLGIPKYEAERYIASYFERYAGVKQWIDAQIAEVRRTGYTLTLDGRRRPIPDMDAKNPNARGFAERTAVNTPLQGTAADLIKRAMIRLDEALRGQRARMLLQVHDELVLECPPEELDETSALVKSTMEAVADLEVPLRADTGAGPNWRDAKH